MGGHGLRAPCCKGRAHAQVANCVSLWWGHPFALAASLVTWLQAKRQMQFRHSNSSEQRTCYELAHEGLGQGVLAAQRLQPVLAVVCTPGGSLAPVLLQAGPGQVGQGRPGNGRVGKGRAACKMLIRGTVVAPLASKPGGQHTACACSHLHLLRLIAR